MSDADDAYAAAEAEIERVREAGGTALDLTGKEFSALNRLPDRLGKLENLERLDLRGVPVCDLAPLVGLMRLQSLDLSGTGVTDIAPLQSLNALRSLTLDGTRVADLRPLLNLDGLWETSGEGRPRDLSTGLWFRDTLAAVADAKIQELADIDDAMERAEMTRSYLQTLPPWPEPLPWELAGETQHSQPSDVESDGAAIPPDDNSAPLMVQISESGRLEAALPGDLAEAETPGAKEAWRALGIYLDELSPLQARISNAMPNLGRAMDSLRRARGSSFEDLSEIDLGMQANRVVRLASDAGTYLQDQDQAELDAFAAALRHYTLRFSGWQAYKEEALVRGLATETAPVAKDDLASIAAVLAEDTNAELSAAHNLLQTSDESAASDLDKTEKESASIPVIVWALSIISISLLIVTTIASW
ncbi:MAG: hypothetical protein QNJ44_12340 [Rhodobacter sp.]|nr:hypothetical protein [Rhodobacter sp.]